MEERREVEVVDLGKELLNPSIGGVVDLRNHVISNELSHVYILDE